MYLNVISVIHLSERTNIVKSNKRLGRIILLAILIILIFMLMKGWLPVEWTLPDLCISALFISGIINLVIINHF
ncbi:hypothetical protein DBT40_02995 [Aerococcus tenax]|nr:hypothetical protein DBT40_02995 [Aerococcus urinae]RAW05823.1 hypothetical protein DBT41_02725 [Aerococcus urinae]